MRDGQSDCREWLVFGQSGPFQFSKIDTDVALEPSSFKFSEITNSTGHSKNTDNFIPFMCELRVDTPHWKIPALQTRAAKNSRLLFDINTYILHT